MKLQDTLPQAIEKWKKGLPVWTASLGGLGPGYEQCIQILLWEIVSRWSGEPMEASEEGKFPKNYDTHAEDIATELDKKFQFSGAQVGAAKSTAYQFLAYGYDEMMAKLPDNRWIQVSRDFPSMEAEQ